MTVFQRLDLGHSVDVALGGFSSPKRLEHSSCSRQAGGQLAAGIREGKRAPLRSPGERAAHTHRVAVRMRRAWKRADEKFGQQQTGREW
jgi:hypothetical protein